MPFVLALLFAIYLFGVKSFGLSVNLRAALTFLGFGLGFYAPNIFLSNQAAQAPPVHRRGVSRRARPALDLRGGRHVDRGGHAEGGPEIGSSSVELAEEMSLLVAELSYLPERRMAYEGLAKRVNYPGVRSVMTAMIQSERYGTPLGGALRVMAKENRDLRMSAAEKKAAGLPAKLTVPMILFFLPVLFIVILGPAIIHVQDILAHSHALKGR